MKRSKVTPEEFLTELASTFDDDARVWLAGFPDADAGDWKGRGYGLDRLPEFDDDLNWYYSTACFARGSKGKKIDQMLGAGAVVIDDPTTKGDAAALFEKLGDPTYRIATSSGNFHWGYFLKEPALQSEMAPVLGRIKVLGLGDRSGNSAIRYARLPCGVNNKWEYDETFRVRCISWNPRRRFRIQDIADALGVSDHDSRSSAKTDGSDAQLRKLVKSGESYHDPIRDLAARWVAKGDDPEDVKKRLRKLMRSCADELRSQDRWQKTYGDIDRNVDSAVEKGWTPENQRSLDDFVAYLPSHSYPFMPTMEHWPAGSVDACVPWPTQSEKRIRPSAWLDRNRPAHSMTWHPGEPRLIEGKVAVKGGWKNDPKATTINQYQPPRTRRGDADSAEPWIEHLHTVFPDDAEYIEQWFAHRVQRPGEKINSALVIASDQGVGKDTLIEPVKRAVGEWNFSEIGPKAILEPFNGFVKSVVLRINEARDLGDIDRFAFYEHMKAYTATPPDTICCNEKHLRQYWVFNVMGVIVTTNHKSDGVYLPPDDRRHYVALSHLTKEDFSKSYWNRLWGWYTRKRGLAHVAAYLRDRVDLTDFAAKATPPHTPAWHAIVAASNAPEDLELSAVIEDLGEPNAITLTMLRKRASGDLCGFLEDHKNRRAIGHRLSSQGYVPMKNPDAKSGLWSIAGERSVAYVKRTLTTADALRAIRALPTRTCLRAVK